MIARDRNDTVGGTCAVFDGTIMRGWRDIDAELRRRRSERAWKLVGVALEQEAVATNLDLEATSGGDVQRAVLALSRDAAAPGSQRICLDDNMLYLETFLQTDTCRILFRKRGLLALQDATTWHLVPEIVRKTTPTRHESFLQQLCAWLSFSATWYEVAESLDEGDPTRHVLHDYIAVLAASSHCVPAQVRIGSTSILIKEDYSMVSTESGPLKLSTTTDCRQIGRLQLMELLAEAPNVEISF